MPAIEKLEVKKALDVFSLQKSTSELWRKEPLDARISRLIKIRDWVKDNRKLIQDALYQDFKKPAEEVDLSEIYVVLSEVKHALKNLHRWAKPQKVESPIALLGSKSEVYHEPKGVCLIISPWNFPFNLTLGPLISAIAAGNTAILKPSELTPKSSELIAQMSADLFDPSEVAVFNGGKEVVESLLQLPFDHIFFTGSPTVGKIVMQQAARHLTPVTLELGGKSPAIIDRTADLSDAAEKVIWGKFINCGQTCIAPDYLLVQETVEEVLLDNLRLSIDHFFDPEGLGIESSPSYARIIGGKQFDRLDSMLTDALEQGSEIECGGSINKRDGYFAPTVLSKVPLAAWIMQEEIFGPILPIITYQDISEVIELINSKPKPLALYIFSGSTDFQNKVLQETSSGSVAVNDCVIQFMNPNLPFGGINHSGFGKSHGHSGFLAFSNQRSVLKQKVGLTSVKLLFPPYTKLTKKAIDFLLKYL